MGRRERALGEQCAAGETGVVVLRGPHVSPGYTDPARNAGMFEQGWLVSGDLGHIDAQGYLHVTGRAKDVIIRGSHNIDPGWWRTPSSRIPRWRCAPWWASPTRIPARCRRPSSRSSRACKLAAMRCCSVAGKVYERPAVPKRVVVLDALPLTAVGKVYKPALRLRATELKLQEVLSAAGRGSLRVEGAEGKGARCVAEVRWCGAGSGAGAALRRALGAIAVEPASAP